MKFRLISCNIRFDNPQDGVHAWPKRVLPLTSTLLSHSPAIIATQEGRFQQLAELKNALQDFHLIDQHRSWIGERMYPTIFTRDDYFEQLKSGDLWLSETPELAGSLSFGSQFPRLMTWVHLQLKESREKVTLINTHLDHVLALTRIQQTQVLIEQIKKIRDPQSKLILMGDFNDHPESDVRLLIEQAFPELEDAWRKFNSNEETSHHGFGQDLVGSRIDWILVDKKINIHNCQLDKSCHQGVYPSDHYPVVCEISF